MKTTYLKTQLQNVINISKIVTVHYYEFDKNFVFNGEVIAGTRGRKVRTKSFNAFSSAAARSGLFFNSAIITLQEILYGIIVPKPNSFCDLQKRLEEIEKNKNGMSWYLSFKDSTEKCENQIKLENEKG